MSYHHHQQKQIYLMRRTQILKLKKYFALKGIQLTSVLLYAFTYAFLKFCNYSFLFWIPTFALEQYNYNEKMQSIMSIIYDVGNVVGCFLIGVLSDKLRFKGILLLASTSISIIFLLSFTLLTPITYWVSFILMLFVGCLMAGTGSVLCTVIASDLSKENRVRESNKGSIVIGIIEGIGSLAAAIGQSIIPRIKRNE